MTAETKEALLQVVDAMARDGYREVAASWPERGDMVVSITDVGAELERQGISEDEIRARFDAAAIKAGR